MLSLMFMPKKEANFQIIFVPILQGTILIASRLPSNFQGGWQPFTNYRDVYYMIELQQQFNVLIEIILHKICIHYLFYTPTIGLDMLELSVMDG